MLLAHSPAGAGRTNAAGDKVGHTPLGGKDLCDLHLRPNRCHQPTGKLHRLRGWTRVSAIFLNSWGQFAPVTNRGVRSICIHPRLVPPDSHASFGTV